MTVLEKVREYIHKEFPDKEDSLLDKIWINPDMRNQECKYPDLSCKDCHLNKFLW